MIGGHRVGRKVVQARDTIAECFPLPRKASKPVADAFEGPIFEGPVLEGSSVLAVDAEGDVDPVAQSRQQKRSIRQVTPRDSSQAQPKSVSHTVQVPSIASAEKVTRPTRDGVEAAAQSKAAKKRRRNLSNPFKTAGDDVIEQSSQTVPESGAEVDTASVEAQPIGALLPGYSDDEDDVGLVPPALEDNESDIEREEATQSEDEALTLPDVQALNQLHELGDKVCLLPTITDDYQEEELSQAPAPLPPLVDLAPVEPAASEDPLWERRQAILRKLENKL